MKNSLFVLFFLTSISLFAQQEWGDVNRNTVTLKEIAPVWPGCENTNIDTQNACFDKKLIDHIIKNFKYPAKEYNNNVQGKVILTFFINEQGKPEVTSVSGASKALQEEAKRNILTIPKMKHGLLGGKFRAITYTIPFTFKTGR
jgi:TonB family protein